MARPRRVDKELVAQAQAVITKAADLEELRCAQAVLLPALLGTTLEQTRPVVANGYEREFVYVYGAAVGMAAWQRVEPALQSAGHRRNMPPGAMLASAESA